MAKISSLVTKAYRVTELFPKSEMFGLINQIRRAAVSIPSNIAEGSGRRSNRELSQFLYIALGSAAELETQFLIACNLGFIDKVQFEEIEQELQELMRMTSALARTLSNAQVNS